MKKTERKDLVVGNEYYFDDLLIEYGIFESRSEEKNETKFFPIVNYLYTLTGDLVCFLFNGDSFIDKPKQ